MKLSAAGLLHTWRYLDFKFQNHKLTLNICDHPGPVSVHYQDLNHEDDLKRCARDRTCHIVTLRIHFPSPELEVIVFEAGFGTKDHMPSLAQTSVTVDLRRFATKTTAHATSTVHNCISFRQM